MTIDQLQYDDMIQEALRGVMAQAIETVAKSGFPGEHHFLIVFRTRRPDVEISEALLRRFPEEMTIVLQHQFWDLKTDSTGFDVTLSFSNVMEHMRIPYSAVKAFTDPSVKFGLQFHVEEGEDAPIEHDAEIHTLQDDMTAGAPSRPARQEKEAPQDAASETDGQEASGDVVSLDAFRKK